MTWWSLTHACQGFAGHGVSREDHLPAGLVGEAAGEGVLAVVHGAGLELRARHTGETARRYFNEGGPMN